MSDSIPDGATPIGSKLYIFKSKSNSTDALISAHGGYYKGNRSFQVPHGIELIFYGIHGNVLSDPGVKLSDTKAKVVETISGGKQCTDYELSKYQGRHGGSPGKPAETYGRIANRINYVDDNLAQLFKIASTSTNEKVAKSAMKNIQDSRSMSLITIRNRWNSQNVYLKDLLPMVLKSYPGIKRFHCSFCRSLVGDDNAKTSKVEWA